MKKIVLFVIFAVLVLAGCSVYIDNATTFKGSHLFKSFPSAMQVLVVEIDEGTLFVWKPSEKLQEFFNKLIPGERIFLKAQEENGVDEISAESVGVEMKFHIINEIIKLSDGGRYKR